MGFFSFIFLGLLLFVLLRQLPSHKLYVLTRELNEAQTFFASRVEEGLLSGEYADNYRAELNKLQAETDKLVAIMKGVWPFFIRDFYHMLSGVTKQCYKLTDDVERVRNQIWSTSGQEKLRFDMIKMMAVKPVPSFEDSTFDNPIASSSTPTSSTSSTVSSPTVFPFPANPSAQYCSPATTFRPPVYASRSL